MNKLKKSLSILLTLVMLFTTLCFFPLDLGAIEADAAISGIKIVVPETLYLTPSSDSQTAIQYYINNNADGSVKTSQDTTAEIHITYPGATLTSISAKTSANITLPTSITGLVGTTFGTGSTKATGTFSLGAGLSAGSTALVEWTFVFTVNGKTQTHYAYSVAYAPWYLPVGAAARAVGSYGNVYSASILWVTGVHGYSDGKRPNNYYAIKDTFVPMIGELDAPTAHTNPDQWITGTSNGLASTLAYQNISESGLNYHARANTISPTANITVDVSRYNNFKQIPNFKIGFMITDHENASEGTWYVSDYGTSDGTSYYNGTSRGGNRYDSDYEDSGTAIWSNSADTSYGIKKNETWNKSITGTASFRIKSGVYGYRKYAGIKCTSWNNNFVNISVTGANKGTLRTNVLNGTSYAKENYTSATWNEYYSALKTAATNLGNPTSSTVDTSTLTTKEAALQTTAHFDANGGTLGCAPSVDFVIGGNATASFPQSTLIAAYPATRTGYTFKGWSTDKNATTAPETLTVGLMQTVYAVWQPKLVFDNLIDLKEWQGRSPNNATAEFIADGIKLTSNDGAGEGTYASHYFPVEPGKSYQLKFDDIGAGWDVYFFFCDANGNWIGFADGAKSRTSDNATEDVSDDINPQKIFTADEDTAIVKAQIRLDANGSNNTVEFNNIHVYEVGKVEDGVSYTPSKGVDYGAAYGELPTPTKYGSVFAGWVDASGNSVTSSSTVDFMGIKYLYSTWTLGTYTITFDTDGGSAVSPITQQYNTAVTAPADPTKTGYEFKGWDKDIPTTMPGQNITVKAIWEELSYSVNFDGNGNTGGSAPEKIDTAYTNDITIPENEFIKTGHNFVNWNTKSDGSGTSYAPGQIVNKLSAVKNGAVTLYAQWSVISYTITFDTDGGSAIAPITQNYGTTVNAPANPTKTGYVFKGWDKDIPATMPAENITIKAIWTEDNYTITFDTDGGSAIADATYAYGSAVTAPAAPKKTGYTFAGWEGLPETMPAGNITVKAKWTANTYTINYDTDGGSATDSATATYDNDVTLAAGPTKTGYIFKGWSFDGTTYAAGQTVKNLATDGEITLTAIWEANTYTVTFDKNDAEATGSMAAQSFTYDAAANLTELGFAKTGWSFVEWNTASDGSGKAYTDMAEVVKLTATPDGNVTLYAIWTINLYDVTFVFRAVDGTELTVVRNYVPHGTAFAQLQLPEASEGFVNTYYTTKDAPHYDFASWNEAVVTAPTTFTAAYTEEAHSFNSVFGTYVPATCEEDGSEDFECACGLVYTEVYTMTGHKWSQTGTTVTCTEDGFISYECLNTGCSETKQEPGTAPGHTFSEVTPEAPPTCVSNGLKAYKTCEKCHLYFEENAGEKDEGALDRSDFVLNAGGHSEMDLDAVEPGCETTGLTAGKQCKICGEITVKQQVIKANGHSLGEYIIDVEPECEATGLKHKECENCDYKKDPEVIDALGHNEVSHGAQEPDCENEGWNAYVACTRCDYSTKVTIPAKDHVLHTVAAKAPTCEAFGWDEYEYCTREGCSYSTYAEKDALGHKYEGKVTLEPTCTAKGEKTFTCANDSTHTYKEDVPALGHNEVAHEAKAPTCEKEGWDAYVTCTRCDYSTYEKKDALGHDYAEVVTFPTCEAPGYTTYTCKNDSEHTYTDKYVDALGHTGSTPVKEKEVLPTCTVGGTYEEVVYCAVCGEELSRESKTTDPTGHTNATRQENIHNATCTEAGSYDEVTYCSVCDVVLKTEPVTGAKLPHTYEEKIPDESHRKTEATCYAAAVYYYDCINCTANAKGAADADKYTFSDGEPTGKHTEGEPEIEDYIDSTCYAEGSYNEVVYCSVCNAAGFTTKLSTKTNTVEKKEHTPGEAKTEDYVDSTCYEEGSYNAVVYCSVENCGEKLSSTPHTVAKKAHTPGEAIKKDYTPPTCYAVGTYNEVVYCSVEKCAAQLSSTPKTEGKIAHTKGEPVREHIVDSTCYQTGTYDEVTYCSVCKAAGKTEELSRVTKVIAVKAHTAGKPEKENVVDSTCYQTGTYDEVTYCSVCKAAGKTAELSRVTKDIPVKEHTPGEAKTENFVDSTCYEEGSYNAVVYCSVEKCGEKLSSTTKTVAKKAHTPGEAITKDYNAPTCYAEGSYNEVVYCSVEKCAAQLSSTPKTIDKIDHTPAEAVREEGVAPGCETDGYHYMVVYCSVCASNNIVSEISREKVTDTMTGHTEGETVIENDIEATCTVNGSYDEVVYCTVCGEELSRDTKVHAAPGHTEGEEVIENNVAATCTVDGSYDVVVYCSVCGEELSRENKVHAAPGHTKGEEVIENNVAATCTVDGSYDVVVYCSVCGEEISREEKVHAAPGHTEGEAVVENEVDVTCTADGSYDEAVYCTVCGEELSRTTYIIKSKGHTPAAAVKENNVPPTETEDGHYDNVVYCSVCNEEISRETIVVRPVRIVTFVLYNNVIEVESYLGENIKAPTVPDYTSADGFIHKFKSWDKPITQVSGNTTYTAVYTEPCNYAEFDALADILNDVLEGGLADDALLAENKAQIESLLKNIEEINKNRNTRDKEDQLIVDFVTGQVEEIIEVIYPDAGLTLIIQGSAVAYAGTILDLKAIRMPINVVASDVVWTSSDENIVFFANGKLYAVGTGTVTLTATKGILTASKTVTIIEGGNTRGITFTSINNTHFIIEDYMAVYNSAIVYWSDDFDLRFRVQVYQSFMFEDYIVYINGVEVEADAQGYYVVPAGSGDARITIAGAMYDTDGEGGDVVTKWSFWEWLLNFFRKIADFFKNLF